MAMSANVLQHRWRRTRGYSELARSCLHLSSALLAGNATATVLLGQRNAKQVDAAAAGGDALGADEAAWVKGVYRGTIAV